MNHLLLTSPIATQLWKFYSFADINIEGMNLRQVVNIWRSQQGKTKLRHIYKIVPGFIMWELWRRRNSRRHGKNMETIEC